MTRQIRFERRSLRDLEEAVDWSEAKQIGFGRRVENAILNFIESIAASPEIHPIYADNVRQAYMRKLRYLLFYIHDKESVTILAIRHGSRSLEDLSDRF
ncbi:MAG: type II toxin-antitoxin system RelE/ParE family toxin [Fimbriiglobus sp.]